MSFHTSQYSHFLNNYDLFQLVNVVKMVPEMFLVITTLENVLAKLMSLVINATSVHQDFTHFPFVKVRGIRNKLMYYVVLY